MGNTNSAASSADASNRPSGLGSPARGRKKQGGKYSQCTYVLYLAKIELFYTLLHVRCRDFFNRIFEFPLSKNVPKRTKKSVREKKNRRTTP